MRGLIGITVIGLTLVAFAGGCGEESNESDEVRLRDLPYGGGGSGSYSGTITVREPEAGSVHRAGDELRITWSLAGSFPPTCRLELHRGGTTVADIASDVSTFGSVHAWAVPASLPGGEDYRIAILAEGIESATSPKFTLHLARPDIYVDEVVIEGGLYRGEASPIRISVGNRGLVEWKSMAPIGRGEVKIYLGAHRVGGGDLESVRAQDYENVYGEITPPSAGEQELRVEVGLASVEEDREDLDDNVYRMVVQVREK